jgi:hypothetical protein
MLSARTVFDEIIDDDDEAFRFFCSIAVSGRHRAAGKTAGSLSSYRSPART